MKDLIETMAILVAVSDGGSLSNASRALKIPLATISRKISELEAHLNVKLLTRSTRALKFTDSGRAYVLTCRGILDDVREAERAVTGEYQAPKGHLTITAPIVFGRLHVLPVVTKFLQAYPDVDIKLFLSDSSVDLLEEKIDVALRIGELPNSSLLAVRLGTMRQITCGSPDYFKQFGHPEAPADLKKHQCITSTILGSASRWTYWSGKAKVDVSVHSRLEVSNAEAALEAAAHGIGITRAMCYQAVSFMNKRQLDVILRDFEPAPWPVHLLHASGRIIPLKLRAFLDFAAPRLKEDLTRIASVFD